MGKQQKRYHKLKDPLQCRSLIEDKKRLKADKRGQASRRNNPHAIDYEGQPLDAFFDPLAVELPYKKEKAKRKR